MLRVILMMLMTGLVSGCGPAALSAEQVPEVSWELIANYPHDPQAFTQGLFYHEGALYESTGQYGESTVRKVELESGRVLQSHELEDEFFAEGLALFKDRLYQLTWREGRLLIYDVETLEPQGSKGYWTEGWGLTTDGEMFIMSDGTSRLSFRDPKTFEEVRKVQVTLEGRSVDKLNELEFIDDKIWANIWQKDYLLRIDPKTGRVEAMLDLSKLSQKHRKAGVLNGIAWDPQEKLLYVTGKNWPRLYALRLK